MSHFLRAWYVGGGYRWYYSIAGSFVSSDALSVVNNSPSGPENHSGSGYPDPFRTVLKVDWGERVPDPAQRGKWRRGADGKFLFNVVGTVYRRPSPVDTVEDRFVFDHYTFATCESGTNKVTLYWRKTNVNDDPPGTFYLTPVSADCPFSYTGTRRDRQAAGVGYVAPWNAYFGAPYYTLPAAIVDTVETPPAAVQNLVVTKEWWSYPAAELPKYPPGDPYYTDPANFPPNCTPQYAWRYQGIKTTAGFTIDVEEKDEEGNVTNAFTITIPPRECPPDDTESEPTESFPPNNWIPPLLPCGAVEGVPVSVGSAILPVLAIAGALALAVLLFPVILEVLTAASLEVLGAETVDAMAGAIAQLTRVRAMLSTMGYTAGPVSATIYELGLQLDEIKQLGNEAIAEISTGTTEGFTMAQNVALQMKYGIQNLENEALGLQNTLRNGMK